MIPSMMAIRMFVSVQCHLFLCGYFVTDHGLPPIAD